MGIVFPKGTFYSCHADVDHLTHDDPESAVADYFDADVQPGMDEAAVLAAIRHPVNVYAWEPMKVPSESVRRWAERLTESLHDDLWGEEYDPEGDQGLCAEADAIMLDAVTRIIEASPSWTCEVVGMVALTADQVEELMREMNPNEWFGASRPSALPSPDTEKGGET